MRRRAWNIVFHELAGLRTKILTHPDPTIKGLEGVILLETANSLLVEAPGRGRIRVIKHPEMVLLVEVPGEGWLLLYGWEVRGDPVERLKKLEKMRGVGWLVREGEKRRYSRPTAPGEDLQRS